MQPTKRRVPLVISLVIILVVTGLTLLYMNVRMAQSQDAAQRAEPTATSSDPDPENDVVAAPGDRVTIVFNDEGFQPKELEIKKGTIVTVKNESTKRVQFSSDEHPSHRDNPEMNLKVLQPGEATSYNAGVIGSWAFHDHLDDRKTGKITVTE